MRKLVALGLCFAAFLSMTNAENSELQSRLAKKSRANKIEKITTELNLSATQVSELKEIQNDFHNNLIDIRNNTHTAEDGRQAKAKLLKDRKARIHALLTPEQQEKAASLKTEHQSKRKRKHRYSDSKQNQTPENRAKKITNKMDKLLDLTQSQTEKVASINLTFAIEFDALKKQHKMRERIGELRKSQRMDLAKVLTEKQLGKLDEIEKRIAHRKHKHR